MVTVTVFVLMMVEGAVPGPWLVAIEVRVRGHSVVVSGMTEVTTEVAGQLVTLLGQSKTVTSLVV